MAVTYPLAMPTSGITSVTWTNANVSFVSRSPFTFQGQVQNYPGQIRFATVSITDVMRTQADEWLGFLDALNGSRGTFLFGDPSGISPKGVGTGTPVVNGASITGSTLPYRGATASTTGWLKAGDWIQIGAGLNTRLYKVTRDSNSNASGQGNLEIWPNLRITPADGATIVRSNTKGLFRLSAGTYDYTEDNSCRYTINFNCEEVI